ncbi:arylsulfatase A-like enzyme [Bradyrhizobium sp. LM2.7]
MARAKNVLWIMCDQLRYDYLGCTGHPSLKTPNIDAMAKRGVLFTKAYVQSPICGPSRMSFYTGRYMRSHGSHWNGWPLRVGEPTLGDHLKAIGVRNVLVGKTHMAPDIEGMKRLGIPPESIVGVRVAECGFEPYERDDGLHPTGRPRPKYDDYLRKQGFEATNPWEHWANSGAADDGSLQNGWLLTHADKAARVPEEHSETPYMTRRAMDFIAEAETDGKPWCLHLSYIKPHWPYIAPEPYASMYSTSDMLPVIRSERERQNPHPVFGAYMDMRYSRNMARDDAREKVIPTYMGLITQIDDQMGVLMKFLEEHALLETTMIVFTSDHGDYLGDHWNGREGPVPRTVGEDPADRHRSIDGRGCDARHAMRRTGRRHRSRADFRRLFRRQGAGTHPRRTFAAAAAARADAVRLAQGRILRIRLRHAGRPAEIESADRALPPVHGVRRPLEVHPRLRLPSDAV